MSRLAALGVGLDALTFSDVVAQIAAWAARRESRMVATANVHMLMEARNEPEYAAALRAADLITPDGVPVMWLMRLLGASGQDRVAGMDLMPALCRVAERRGLSIFFLGSTEEVLEAIRRRLEHDYPRLRIAGMASPPFRPSTADEDAAMVRRINVSGAHLLFVSLGCPRQERWIHDLGGGIRAVAIGLGGAFPVFAGSVRRAPAWARHAGLEWAFRLLQEPRRLWKRYASTNLPFLALALREVARHALGFSGSGFPAGWAGSRPAPTSRRQRAAGSRTDRASA